MMLERNAAATAREPAAFEWPLRVYWEDTDAGGIVFYANYLKYFERARTEWLRSLGMQQQRLLDEAGGMFVVTGAQLRYLRPARLDDELIVTTCLRQGARASLTIAQQALRKPGPAAPDAACPRALLCEGVIRVGWVDARTLHPARIPPALVQQLTTP